MPQTVRKGKEKPVRLEAENSDTDTENETGNGNSSAGEEIEGWWMAGKKGKNAKKVSFVCKGGDAECGKIITRKESCIQCEACGEWYHPSCQGLCSGAFEAISEYDLLWICKNCKERLLETLDIGKRVETRVAEAEKKIIEKVVETRKQAAADIDNKLEVGIKNMETKVAKQMSETSDSLKDAMKSQQVDKVDRSCNIILHNIEESVSNEPIVRKEHDVAKIQEIAQALGIDRNQCKIQNAFRLGKKAASEEHVVTNKPRLLLVKLETKDQVETLMKERFNLKERGYPNIYVTKDLPLEERERQRKLRAELQEKGKDTHKIVRGRIVPKN